MLLLLLMLLLLQFLLQPGCHNKRIGKSLLCGQVVALTPVKRNKKVEDSAAAAGGTTWSKPKANGNNVTGATEGTGPTVWLLLL